MKERLDALSDSVPGITVMLTAFGSVHPDESLSAMDVLAEFPEELPTGKTVNCACPFAVACDAVKTVEVLLNDAIAGEEGNVAVTVALTPDGVGSETVNF